MKCMSIPTVDKWNVPISMRHNEKVKMVSYVLDISFRIFDLCSEVMLKAMQTFFPAKFLVGER